MSSSSSSSSSSAALATVTVTARDIEFSDYNSATGKWESAVMTMMIEDTNTPDNINLEVYSEKVYAVFRNHDDPTDLVEFSPEVDGMDFRVTTSDPMVPSAKYELYKVYGETSGGEYATSSQFYFQVPGKVWDFANDVVDHDVELVSDWFNYGYIKDTNDVIHGVTTKDELRDAVSSLSDSTVFTVDGTPLTRQDVKGVKITSMLDSDMQLTTPVDASFLNRYDNVEEVDIVSAKVTKLMRHAWDNFTYEGKVGSYYGCSGFSIPKINQKIAFPETLRFLTFMASSPTTGTSVFNKPIYMPDSVTTSYYLLSGHNNKSIFNSKVRFSPNLNYVPGNNLYQFGNWNHPIEPIGQNYQLTGTSMTFLGFSGYNQPFTIPSVWTYIPDGFLYYANKFDQDIIIPNNIVDIRSNALRNLNLGGDGVTKKIILPSTITTIGQGAFYSVGRTTAGVEVDMSSCDNITSYGADFGWSTIKDFKWPSRFASNNISIVNGAFSYATFKIDPDPNTDFVEFALPEGISELGNSAFRSIYRSANMKVVMPSTLTKIGHTCFYQWDMNNTKKMHFDFTKLNPDDVVIDDRLDYNGLRNDVPGFAVLPSDYSRPWYDLTIEVAPGTKEAWEAKLPDFKLVNPDWAQNTTFSRKINWVEPTTEYGKLVYYPNYTTTWGVSSSVGTEPDRDAEIYDIEEFENWIGTLSPAPRISATGDLRFDSPNGEDLQYTDINGDTQTIQFGVWEIRGASLNFDYSAPEKYVVFNSNAAIDTVDQTSTAEVELTSLAQYNSLCMSGIPDIYDETPVMDKTTRITVGANSTVIPIACIKSYEFGTVPTTIPNYFLVASSVESVDMSHANITTIGDGFLCGCGYFNSNVDLTGVTSVGTNFLSKCVLFNGTLGDMSSLTAIGTRFLYNCQVFNHPIQLPSAITSLDSFLALCQSFNYPLDFSHITTIGDEVLNSCKAFNYSLDLSHVTSVGDYFLANCDVYNRPVTIANVTSVGSYFLANCNVYNQPVTIANVTSVGNYFLSNCPVFNSQVLLPNCTTFGTGFMQLCTIFNQPINMTNVTNCGAQFLMMCKAFNQPLDLSNLVGAGTANGYGAFLNHCDAFNQPLNLPKIRYFGGLNYMASFNSNVTFGPYLEKLSNWSFAYNDKMCKTYDFNTVNPNNVQVGSGNYFNSLFVTTNSSTDAYVNGVKIAGTNRSAWMTKCPNNSSGTFTRRLINAGY